MKLGRKLLAYLLSISMLASMMVTAVSAEDATTAPEPAVVEEVVGSMAEVGVDVLDDTVEELVAPVLTENITPTNAGIATMNADDGIATMSADDGIATMSDESADGTENDTSSKWDTGGLTISFDDIITDADYATGVTTYEEIDGVMTAVITVTIDDEFEAEGVVEGIYKQLTDNSATSGWVYGMTTLAGVDTAYPDATKKDTETAYTDFDDVVDMVSTGDTSLTNHWPSVLYVYSYTSASEYSIGTVSGQTFYNKVYFMDNSSNCIGTEQYKIVFQNDVASITKNGTTTNYATLEEAVADAESGDTIVMDDTYTIESGTTLTVPTGVTLTITNGFLKNYGTIVNDGTINTVGYGIVDYGTLSGNGSYDFDATVTVDGSDTPWIYATLATALTNSSGRTVTLLKDLSTANIWITKSCTIDLGGYTITGGDSYSNAVILVYDSTKSGIDVTIKNGTITSSQANGGSNNGYVIWGYVGYDSITIEDLTITNTAETSGYGVVHYTGDLVVNSGSNISASFASIAVYGANDSGDIVNVEINGGTIGNEDATYGLTGQGAYDYTNITINGGTIQGYNMAIYHPQVGDLTINGGTITGYYSGIQYSGEGALVMADGTVEATVPSTVELYKDSADGDGGIAQSGAAILFMSRGGGYQDGLDDFTGEINGGTIKSAANAPIIVCRMNKVTGEWVFNEDSTVGDNYLDSLTITGGTFIGATDFSIEPVAESEGVVSISGGEYSVAPSDAWLAAGYHVSEDTNDNGYYYVYTEATVTDTSGEITYAGTLEAAVAAANSGDTITIYADIEMTSNIAIGAKSLTFVGATGEEEISNENGSYRFSASEGETIVFENLDFDVYTTLLYPNSSIGITFNNCDITLNGTAYLFSTNGCALEVTFTNNTVGGTVKKVFIVRVDATHSFVMTGNTITFEGSDVGTETTSAVGTIVVQGEGAKVTITDNMITDFYRGFSIDNSTATGSWTITGNSFINTRYALNYTSAKDCNDISMAYNYNSATADGTGTEVGLLDEVTPEDTSGITLYPYYADSALTILVYEDGESSTVDEVATEILADVDSLTTTDEINEAAMLVALADTTTMLDEADDDEAEALIEAINELDAAFLEINTNIDVTADLTEMESEEYTIQQVEVEGLALAVYGSSVPADDVELILDVDQIESADDVDLAFTAVPYVSVNSGDATKVENEDLNAPVTFQVYLPDTFEGNHATVVHVKSDGSESTYNLTVYTDESGNKYIQLTVTEFSNFYVTGYTYTSTSSSGGTSYYSSSVASTSNGDVSISSSRSTMNTTITITTTPDDGYEVDTVSVTYSSGKEVSVTDNGDGTYSYKQPGASVTVTVTFVATDDTNVDDDDSFFIDVDEDAYYYDAVVWAVENGITSGTTDTTFSPNNTCTRAQAVTFLWRAAGEPVVDYENPFTDVDADSYYYEAVLWAVSEGITAGTSDTTFSPNAVCSRSQIVTFLYRAAGEPEVTGDCDFTDVSADSYYYNAVLWAVENGITDGTSATTFSPSNDCTRGQIVTFLYRNLGE